MALRPVRDSAPGPESAPDDRVSPVDPAPLEPADLLDWARAGLLRHLDADDGRLDALRKRLGERLSGYDGMHWPEIDLLLAEAVQRAGGGLARLVPDPYRDLPGLYLLCVLAAVEIDPGTTALVPRLQGRDGSGWLGRGSVEALLAGLFPESPALAVDDWLPVRHRLVLLDGVGPAVLRQLYTSADHWHALSVGRLLGEFAPIDPDARDDSADLALATRLLGAGRGLALRCEPARAAEVTAAIAARLGRRPVRIDHEDWRQRSVRGCAWLCDWLALVDCRELANAPVAADEIRRQAVLLLRGEQQVPEGYVPLDLPAPPQALRRRWWAAQLGGRLGEGGGDGLAGGPGDADVGGLLDTLAAARLGRADVARIGEQLGAAAGPEAAAAAAPASGSADPAAADLLRRVRLIRSADGSAHLRRVALPVDTHVDDGMLILTGDTRLALARCRERCLRRDYGGLDMGETVRATASAGVVLLFSGASGTGKTLAASWLASRLGAPLYRVDLAMVMNKYVGETEKNLSLALDEAAKADVMLLFDEADALFGKRTEGSHGGDRFANMLTNFLLARIETHPGIVVLTTNAGGRVDSAFQRRIDMAVEFKPLAAPDRLRLWQALLGPRAPDAALLRVIARHCELAPGHVRNCVVNACCWYPDQVPLSAAALWQALDAEYRKASRSMPPQLMELRGTAPEGSGEAASGDAGGELGGDLGGGA